MHPTTQPAPADLLAALRDIAALDAKPRIARTPGYGAGYDLAAAVAAEMARAALARSSNGSAK